ncbi:endothelin-1 [Nothobranchius furzeri]|uniref:endothelin-1 n=1 Tax=Nothobranchius furzeri TaxID=105023 RepID=UPI0024046CA6|nr:endothelin-1 [Nothobranchius furzeri]
MDLAYVWLLANALMLIHQFQAAVMGPVAEEGPLAQLHHTAHRRDKRCSCENQKDKECIFFCHIGIVWVNSPSHVVPYGFGSVRVRRDLQRCSCSQSQDVQCLTFCFGNMQLNDDLKPKKDKLKTYSDAFWDKRSRHALKYQT